MLSVMRSISRSAQAIPSYIYAWANASLNVACGTRVLRISTVLSQLMAQMCSLARSRSTLPFYRRGAPSARVPGRVLSALGTHQASGQVLMQHARYQRLIRHSELGCLGLQLDHVH